MLMLELYEGEKKVAELPAHEVIAMSQSFYRIFWQIQTTLGRHEEYTVIPDPEGP